ncbi:hypothetical protein EYR40_006078 [Pleurotus pulmonarius]|nr:hypothetical protein EYR40_006078 [Pleurotus pulmonarius]
MRSAMKVVEEAQGGATLAAIRAALQASKNVERLCGWYPNTQHEAEENIVKLKEAVRQAAKLPRGEFDTPVRSRKPKAEEKMVEARKKGRKITIAPTDMADALEVARTMQAVASHLELAGDMEHCPTEAERHAYVEMLEEGDIGVEVMSKKTADELCTLLSFHGGRPGQWNAFLRDDGATAWHLGLTPSNPVVTRRGPSNTIINITLDMFKEGGYGFKPMSLLWHQLVGVAAIVSQMWYGQRVTSAPMSGVLLADGVGVGKTAQVMATIAFIQQVELIEQVAAVAEKVNRPPIIRNMPWFMGTLEKVPNEPHLIIVPLSLVGQWKDELYRFFSRGAVDVFQIPNALDEIEFFFTDPKGPWKLSKQKMVNRIVVCAHSVFDVKKHRGTFVDGERPFLKHARYKFIFEMTWCSSWIDEAHLFRGQGRGLTGGCQLNRFSRVVHVLTATPLFTKIQDIINMARLMNHDEFVLSKGHLLERSFNTQIRAAKRKMTQEEKDAVKSRNLRVLRGQADDDDDDDSGIAVRFAQYNAAKVVQAKIAPHMIRRTLTSVDLAGKPLNSKMPPVTEHILTLRLSDREMKNLNLIVDEMELTEGGVPADLSLENFWLTYRCGVVFFKALLEDWPIFDVHGNSKIGHYSDISSTKLDMIARLVSHLLSHDDIEHPSIVDGQVVFPPPPPTAPGQEPPQTRKVLMYHEFTMMASTIQTIFRMKGIGVMVLNGLTKKEERDRIIDDFVHSDSPEHRVLLFSSVGSVGLNLTVADTVIMIDTIWSQVGTEQIIGRSARLTQEHPVHVYHLVALGTTDVLMSTMAREKGEMLRTLFTKERNENLERVFHGRLLKGAVDDGDNDLDEDGNPRKKKKSLPKTRTARGAAKNASVTSISRSSTPSTSRASKTPGVEGEGEKEPTDGIAGEGDEPNAKGKAKGRAKPPAKPRPKPKAKGRQVKSAPLVNDEDDGPSEPPTAGASTTEILEKTGRASRPPTEEAGMMDVDEPSREATTGSTEKQDVARPSGQPALLTGPGSAGIARPAPQPVVQTGPVDDGPDVARPSGQPALLTGPGNVGIARPAPQPVVQTGPVDDGPDAARPSGQPTLLTGPGNTGMARPAQQPAVQTGHLNRGANSSPPSQRPAPRSTTTPPGWVATQPATQAPGWVATQPATQAPGWVATQPATQSPALTESMEIDGALRPSTPQSGTEDAPMDVDEYDDMMPVRGSKPAVSKADRARAAKAAKAGKSSKARKSAKAKAASESRPDQPPFTQASPSTPPRAGSKHKSHSSPEKSPNTELRQRKASRTSRDHRRGSRIPDTDSEEGDLTSRIALIKQEGEPSGAPLYDDDDIVSAAPSAAVESGPEDFTSLIADLC